MWHCKLKINLNFERLGYYQFVWHWVPPCAIKCCAFSSKKSRIRETPNLLTDANSSTNIFFRWLSPSALLSTSFRAKNSAQSRSLLFSTIQYQFHFPQIGMKGEPMKGLEVIIWSEGQWEASKKIKNKQTDRCTGIGTTRPKRPKGRFRESCFVGYWTEPNENI